MVFVTMKTQRMILDLHRQRAQEATRAAAPEVPKEPTLSENLQDAQKSVLFGRMLELDPKGIDLAQKLKNPDAGELKLFAEQNVKFNEKMRAAKDLGDGITKDTIKEFAKDDSVLQAQLEIMRPEQLAQLFKNQLPFIAISDETRFNRIKDAFDTMKSFREGAYKNLDQQITKICTDNRFNQERFVDIMRNPDPNQRIALLRKEIKSAFGFKNFVTAGLYARTKAHALESGGAMKSIMDTAMHDLDTRMQDIGSVLGLTIEQNDEVRQAFAHEMMGERGPAKPESSFRDMRTSLKSEKDVLDAWKTERDKAAYKNLPDDAARQAYADDWVKRSVDAEERSANEKGGFWSKVRFALAQMLFSNTKSKLELK